MKMKYIILLLISSLLIIQPVMAWGPHGHTYLANEMFEDPKSEIIEQCLPYKDAFLAGSEIPDITVVYYYSEGGKNYRYTHNWNFQQEVMSQAQTPDEICFAYGISAHLIADSVAHTDVVPEAIGSTLLPNWLIHPLLEKKYDSVLIKEHPELVAQTPHMLDAMYGEKGDRYFEMVEYALGDNVDVDVRSDTLKLSYALGSFYDTAYKPRGEVWMFKMYPYMDGLTNFVEPLVSNKNIGMIDHRFRSTEEVVVNTYNNWGTRYQLSPHGFDELNEANKTSSMFNWILLLLMISPVIPVYYTRKFRYMILSLFIFLAIISISYIFV